MTTTTASTKADHKTKLAQKKRLYSEKFKNLDKFEQNRVDEYRQQVSKLTKRLNAIKNGTDTGYLECLVDLQEKRDYELVRLKKSHEFLLERSRKSHELNMDMINKQHEKSIRRTEDKLVDALESAARSNGKNKSLIEISGDGKFDFGLFNNPAAVANDGTRKLRNRNDHALKVNYSNNGSGSDSSEPLVSGGSAGNRRQQPPRGGTSGGNGGARSDWDSFFSDLSSSDAVEFGETRVSTARNAKATKALTSLRQDEINADLLAMKKRTYR